MKIKKLQIEGVGGIKQLDLKFNERMNILCGPNGIGKTTILETIGHIFSNVESNILKRNVSSEVSKISAEIEIDGDTQNKEIQFSSFTPESRSIFAGFHLSTSGLISLKTTRTFQYQALPSVSKDTIKENYILWNDAINGINLTDVKNWFVNRYLYSPHVGALSSEQLNNFELAKKCFSLLNEDFSFSRVNASSNEIMINTPSGEIYYEYLSSGFKSIISILFGIIKEIEFRFTDPQINAEDFQGIILIDEIELHLHPEWQEKILDIILKVFPKAQFFASTHSPHIIQTAKPKQIIALGLDNSNVYQRELPNSEYGFQGWTIEEVLIDVMGMTSLRTKHFKDLITNFEKAADSGNVRDAMKIYKQLNKLLHPGSTLRKLLKFEILGI